MGSFFDASRQMSAFSTVRTLLVVYVKLIYCVQQRSLSADLLYLGPARLSENSPCLSLGVGTKEHRSFD